MDQARPGLTQHAGSSSTSRMAGSSDSMVNTASAANASAGVEPSPVPWPAGFAGAVPGPDPVARLRQVERHRAAHRTETDKADFHHASPCVSRRAGVPFQPGEHRRQRRVRVLLVDQAVPVAAHAVVRQVQQLGRRAARLERGDDRADLRARRSRCRRSPRRSAARPGWAGAGPRDRRLAPPRVSRAAGAKVSGAAVSPQEQRADVGDVGEWRPHRLDADDGADQARPAVRRQPAARAGRGVGEQDRRPDAVEQPREAVGVHVLRGGEVRRQRSVAGNELVHGLGVVGRERPLRVLARSGRADSRSAARLRRRRAGPSAR